MLRETSAPGREAALISKPTAEDLSVHARRPGLAKAVLDIGLCLLILPAALFVMGLILALLREYTGSVVPGILLHVMQNGIAIIAIQAALVAAS